MSSLTCQQPFNALPEEMRDSKQHLSSDLGLAVLISRELSLADSDSAREGLLIGVKPAEFAQASADQLPIYFLASPLRHRFSLTAVYHSAYIITIRIYIARLNAALFRQQGTLPTTQEGNSNGNR